MALRRAGRRTVAARHRKKTVKQGKTQQMAGRKDAPMQIKERRQLVQMIVCTGVFLLLVAAKLLLPDRVAQLNERLSGAMVHNIDVQAVFSAVGKAFSEGDGGVADQVYQAVFHAEESSKEQPISALMPREQSALEILHTYTPEKEIAEEISEEMAQQTKKEEAAEISSLSYVLYSEKNLPESVSMEQMILDFDYCTPVCGALSSDFGYREHPSEGEERFHYGVDLAADTGTTIACFADGIVTAVGDSSSYGKYCMVSHEGGYSTLYAHCSRITVSSGSAVDKGEKIAEVGETGMATGPHLHFELQKGGIYLNPIYYVSSV